MRKKQMTITETATPAVIPLLERHAVSTLVPVTVLRERVRCGCGVTGCEEQHLDSMRIDSDIDAIVCLAEIFMCPQIARDIASRRSDIAESQSVGLCSIVVEIQHQGSHGTAGQRARPYFDRAVICSADE